MKSKTYGFFYVPHVSGLHGLLNPASEHQDFLGRIYCLKPELFDDIRKFYKSERTAGIFKNPQDFLERHFGAWRDEKGGLWMLRDDDAKLRKNQALVKLFHERFPDLVKVAQVPAGMKVHLHVDDDGSESVHEDHRVWR